MSVSVESEDRASRSATAPRVSHLRDLDYSVVQQCMHCGLCLPTCPTYDATKLERNSPRGRISLMRAIADGRLEPSKAFADEMYFCLGCLACMTACPAGVNYAELFEHARAEAEETGVLNNPKRGLIRSLTLRWLFFDMQRLQLLGAAIRLYQQVGLQSAVRNSGVMNLFPKRAARIGSDDARRSSRNFLRNDRTGDAARGDKEISRRGADRLRAGPDVQRRQSRHRRSALAQRLRSRHAAAQNCCGSLHAHNGELEMARELARKNIDQFPPEQFDAIITNAAGCGSHLKHFGNLLADDPHYAARGKAVGQESEGHSRMARANRHPSAATTRPRKP